MQLFLLEEGQIEEISFTETTLRDQVKENGGGKMNGKKRKAVEDESELDETIAQAFRARGMDKQHHKDIIQ